MTGDLDPMLPEHTLEIGPSLETMAPDFTLPDHQQRPHALIQLAGKKGLLLGFTGDMWIPASLRRMLWLQRNAAVFQRVGVNVALIIRDQSQTLYGFYASNPTPIGFPLLADANGDVHRLYNMTDHPGLVMMNHVLVIRYKWMMPEERVWPKIHQLSQAIQSL